MIGVNRFAFAILCLLVGMCPLCRAGEVTLEVAEEYYDMGDTVYFTITNETGLEVLFPHKPIYEIRDSTGYEVYPQIHQTVFVFWDPGHSETYGWGQEYPGGAQVPEGMYYTTASWDYAPGPLAYLFEVADTFYITDMSSVEPPAPSSWGRIKSLFR